MKTLDEYIKLLDQIEAPEFEHLADKLKFYLRNQKFYKVDLNTRKIEAPTFLSVKGDHEAQVICFVVDRFFENMDLTMATWVVQYVNAKGDPYIYRIPFYDNYLLKEEGQIVLPWIIKDPVTITSGKIHFSLQCYRLDKEEGLSYQSIELSEDTYAPDIYYYKDGEQFKKATFQNYDDTKKPYYEYTHKVKGYLYNLQTLPAQSQILHSFDIKNLPELEKDTEILPAHLQLKEMYADLTTLKNQLQNWDIYWEEIE